MSSIIFNITQGLKRVENLLESVDQKAAEFRDRATYQSENENFEKEIDNFIEDINEDDILTDEEDSETQDQKSSDISEENNIKQEDAEYPIDNVVNSIDESVNDDNISENIPNIEKIDKVQLQLSQSNNVSKKISLGKLKKESLLLKKENEKLSQQYKKFQEENVELNKKLVKSEKMIHDLQSANEDVLNELKSIRSISEEKDRAFQLLTTQYAEIQQKYQNLVNENEASINVYQQTIESLKQELNESLEKVRTIENAYADYKVKARKVLNEKEELISQLKSNSLNANDHNGEQNNSNVSNDQNFDDASKNNIAELYKARKLIKQLKSEKSTLEEQLKEIEEISLKSQQTALEKQNNYEMKLEEMKKVIDIKEETIRTQKTLNLTLQRNLDSSNQVIDKLNITIEKNKKTISQLEDQLMALQNNYSKMKILPQKSSKDLEEKIAYLNEQLSKKQSQIDLLLQERKISNASISGSNLPYPSTMKSENRYFQNEFLYKLSKSDTVAKLSSLVPKSNLAKAALMLYLVVLQIWTLYILVSSMRSIQTNK